MNTETLAAIKEVQDLKKNPNKKKYNSFAELLEETEHMKNQPKRMTDQEARELISRAHRAECDEDPRIFLKAVRATLTALGYDEEWVNGHFREIIEDFAK